MAIISVDPISDPRIITVLAPDVAISVQELVNFCREWEDKPENLSYPFLIAAAGKEDIGGGVLVGITATLQNAKIAFEARSGPDWVLCTISGGNLVAVNDSGAQMDVREPTAYVTVDRAASSSATIISTDLDDMYGLITDLHDEAFGKWIMDPVAKTLVLYKADGQTLLQTFNLTDTQLQVPSFIERIPVAAAQVFLQDEEGNFIVTDEGERIVV